MTVTAGAKQPTVRQRDRAAMRRVIADHGFAHAVDSIVTSVVSELVDESNERRMTVAARIVEACMLDALVDAAHALGWRSAT